jgi:hypothetical protein
MLNKLLLKIPLAIDRYLLFYKCFLLPVPPNVWELLLNITQQVVLYFTSKVPIPSCQKKYTKICVHPSKINVNHSQSKVYEH